MTLPIPPSDSLYKFTAIGGLILVVLSLYVPWKMVSDLRITQLDTDLELTKMETANEALSGTLKEIASAMQDLQEQDPHLEKDLDELQKSSGTKNKQPPNSSKLHHLETQITVYKSALKKIESKTEQLASGNEQRNILLAQSKNTLEKQTFLLGQVDTLTVISRITLILGLIMTIWGFWNWNFKFQVYQDRIIKAQAEQWTTPRPDNGKEEIPG